MPVAKNMKVPVAKKAKVTKESAPVMADVAAPTEVFPVPVPVAKAKTPKKMCLVLFILPGWWRRLLGCRWEDGATPVRSTPTIVARCWPETWWCATARCKLWLRGGSRWQLRHIV